MDEKQTTEHTIFGRPIAEVAKELAKHMADRPEKGPTRSERIALIEAHALHTLQHTPLDVTSHDRLFLISEIRRLRRVSIAARVQADCYGAYPGLHAAIKELEETEDHDR